MIPDPMVDEIVDNLHVAVIGLGEAGSAIAADIAAAGVDVIGWDPAVQRPPDGVRPAQNAAAALAEAGAVLSVNAAAVALDVARELAPALARGQIYADLNTAAPRVKAEVAAVVRPTGALFVDVALMAPVPGGGLRTPSLASGPGASKFAELFGRIGMPVEVVGRQPGEAAARKLLRSVFMKGIAAAAIESLAAARAEGCETWLHDELAEVFQGADGALLERLLTGSRQHARRRVHEMDAAAEMLADLGVSPRVCAAASGWLRQLDAEGASAS
jgi:3-hydroxyisobutyrate dehydrogenase-like beta-hydroxyacid dehydrogenase